MAGNIKGITVEIGGNTTPLNDALKEVNKNAKNLQNELGFVEKALKIDPKNVELLTQKQELLTESVSNTAEKLEVLKQAQKKLDDDMQAGLEVDTEQYRQLQRQIVFTEDKLEGLTKELQNFGSVGAQQIAEVGNQMKEVGGKIEAVGKGFSVISAGAGAALTGAATQAVSLEGALNKYIASTGKSIEESEKFEEVLTNIFSKGLGESMEDIADKMGIVSSLLGDLPTDQLEGVVEKSLRLEKIYDMDFKENIRGVDAMMSQFGITADQAFELINQGAQQGLNQNQDLTDQIAEYSTYYAKLGFEASDFFNIMLSGAEDGAYQIDYLNDAMKEFGIRAIDGSDATAGAFQALGLNADEMSKAFAQGGDASYNAFNKVVKVLGEIEDPLKRNEIGVALFGTKFEDLGESAILSMTAFGDQFNDFGDTLEQTSEIMDSGLGSSFESLTRDIQLLGAELGQVLLPIIQPIVDGLRGMVQNFSEMSPTAQKVTVVLLGLVTAIGPLLMGIGSIVSTVGTIMTFAPKLVTLFNTVKTAMMGLNAVMAANPVGVIIIAITALIAIFVTLYNKCEWFRNGVNAIWENIKNAFFGAWDAITNFFTVTIPSVFNTVIDFVKNNWQGLLLLIVNPFAGAFKLLYDNCDGFRTFIDNFIQNVKDFFVNGWNAIVEFFTVSIPEWFASLKAWFGELPYKLGYLLGELIGKTIQFGIDVVNWIKTNVPMFIEKVVTFLKELPVKVGTWLIETYNKIVQFGKDTLAKAVEVGSKFLETIVNYIKELPSKIATWLKNTIAKVTTWVSDMKQKGKEAITGLINAVIEGAKSIPSKMLEIGKNIVDGVWQGIKDAKDAFFDKVSGFFSGIVDGVKDSLGIESPSKVFKREVGYWIPAGVAEGIDENAGVVGESLNSMLDPSNVALNGFNSQGSMFNTMRSSNGLNGNSTSNNYGQNTVNIYTESIDTQNIDRIVDVINRKLGMAY